MTVNPKKEGAAAGFQPSAELLEGSSKWVEAVYAPSEIASMSGNPLVEALPPIRSESNWMTQLLSLPAFDPAQLLDPAHVRAYYVADLKHVFIATPRHAEVGQRIDQLLRWGYSNRSPLSAERAKETSQLYAQMQSAGKPAKLTFNQTVPICSYSLIGTSGMGKSTTVEAVLNSYPQYIFHPKHHFHQLVWLKVDCPSDGGVKELALAILDAIGRALGAPEVAAVPASMPTWKLTRKALLLIRTYGLGILVIDEIQNLSIKKSGGREVMLNFFQELINLVHVPVMLIGTFKAQSVLNLDTRHARRIGTAGAACWKPLQFGAEFRLLVDELWKYQWLTKPTAPTEEMVKTVYDETQGVRGFVVDMFLIAQLKALRKGESELTPQRFIDVAREDFSFLQPALRAVRSRDPGRLRKFEDFAGYSIDDLVDAEKSRYANQSGSRPSDEQTMLAVAARNVCTSLDISESTARGLVMQVLNAGHKTAASLARAAIAAHFGALQKDAE